MVEGEWQEFEVNRQLKMGPTLLAAVEFSPAYASVNL